MHAHGEAHTCDFCSALSTSEKHFTKVLKDVGIEVPKSIETRSKFRMHADKGRG